MSFFNELKRRNVFKAAIAYAVVSWIVLQVAAITFPSLNLPPWTMTMLVVFTVIGFPFICLFAWAFELTPDGIKPTSAVDSSESIRHETGHRLKNFIIVGLVIALGLVLVDSYVLQGSAPDAAGVTMAGNVNDAGDAGATIASSLPPPVVQEIAEKSVAVLPFANLSDDAEQEYFSDGLSDELINKLSQISDLQVTGRNSSFYFKGREVDLRQIGETLAVANILQGSVRRAGNQLRVTAQLMDAQRGINIWSETYDGNMEDIFMVQDEIAEAVTTALSVTLGAGGFNRPGMTRNAAAYDLYLRAWQNDISSRTEIYDAITLLQEALALDPEFGLAWLSLRGVYRAGSIILPLEESTGFNALAAAALARVEAIAPDMPELKLARANTARDEGDWLTAEQQLLALQNNESSDSSAAYGALLANAGRSRDALPYLIRARRLDPLNPNLSIPLTSTLANLGRYDEALAEAERGLALFPINVLNTLKALVLMLDGDRAAGLELMRSTDNAIGIMSSLEQGDAAALEFLQQTTAGDGILQPGVVIMSSIAAAMINEPGYALQLFNRFESINLAFGNSHAWKPYFSELRRLEGFKQVVQDAGLVDYWRAAGNWGDYCRPLPNSDTEFECF